ncbi:hypothetical protein LZ30DRAFT_335720 [Colletotrichum cereale]|nr:hypothetical protein LZ30DRAFT_335720 [Colletotrichum cereale]
MVPADTLLEPQLANESNAIMNNTKCKVATETSIAAAISSLFSAPTHRSRSPAPPPVQCAVVSECGPSLTRLFSIQGLPSPSPPPTAHRPPAPLTVFVIPPGFVEKSGFRCLFRARHSSAALPFHIINPPVYQGSYRGSDIQHWPSTSRTPSFASLGHLDLLSAAADVTSAL